MSIKKIISLTIVLFALVISFSPNIALAINHEYVGCAKEKVGEKMVSSIQPDGTCKKDQERMVCYEGLVPCGKAVTVAANLKDNDSVKWNEDNKVCDGTNKVVVNCQLCHFFVIIDGIMDFIMIDIVPALTVAVLVIGGVMFYFTGAKPEWKNKSLELFKNVLIGLVLIYGAYMIVGVFLMVLGAAEMNPLKSIFDSSKGIFSITCPIELP